MFIEQLFPSQALCQEFFMDLPTWSSCPELWFPSHLWVIEEETEAW